MRVHFLLAASVILFITNDLRAQISQGQSRLKILAEAPIQFSLGYDYSFNSKISAGIQGGVLTQPNSTIILRSMELLGVEEDVVLMIEDAFEFGWVVEGNINYHFERFYVGFFAQGIFLEGKDTPNELVEQVMGVDLGDFPILRSRINDNNLTLKSNLLQMGLLIGKNVSLKNGDELNFELGFSKNFYSSSSISSETRDYSEVSKDVDDYLKTIYHDYAYVPSISVGYVWVIP